MSCTVCHAEPSERVEARARRHGDLAHLPMRPPPGEGEEPVPPGVALVDLCETHRAEFERLGWLVPAEEPDDLGEPNALAYLHDEARRQGGVR